jgi:hypothetical protein
MARELGLGRRFAPDPRDRDYLMARALATVEPDRQYRYWWQNGWWGDQGATPQCVEFAWQHWLADGPHTSRTLSGRTRPNAPPYIRPRRKLYCRSKELDPWQGDCTNYLYEGTSIRAGAQALQEWGYIGNYLWSWKLETIIYALLGTGPLVVGTNWTTGMDEVDAKGFIHYTGRSRGGHAYILNGVSLPREAIRKKGSWGRGWGNNGTAWISFRDFERLLEDGGEAVLATEARPG